MSEKYSIIEIFDKKDFTPLVFAKTSSFTQSYEYGTWQEKLGRKVYRYNILKNDTPVGTFQVIKYPLILSKKYLYIPHGPVINEKLTNELSIFLATEFKKILRETNSAFLRLDIYPQASNAEENLLKKYFTQTPIASYYSAFFQSKFDWHLDISIPENEILANMHQKTRHCVDISQKRGVTVLQVSGSQMMSHFERFYELMQETSTRGKFHLHPKEYYFEIFKSAETDPNIILFIAQYEGVTLANHLLVFYGNTVYYPFGASTRAESNRMPSYALHWHTIKEGKKRGCVFYDFGAVASGDKIIRDNWDGISTFKRKFGGSVLEYGDFYDCVLSWPFYWLYNLRKKLKRI